MPTTTPPEPSPKPYSPFRRPNFLYTFSFLFPPLPVMILTRSITSTLITLLLTLLLWLPGAGYAWYTISLYENDGSQVGRLMEEVRRERDVRWEGGFWPPKYTREVALYPSGYS